MIRIIAGIDSPDGDLASMYINKDIRIGYLSQDPDFSPDDSLLDAILNANEAWMAPLKALYHAQHTHDQKEMEEALAQMDEHHAWELILPCGNCLENFNYRILILKLEI